MHPFPVCAAYIIRAYPVTSNVVMPDLEKILRFILRLSQVCHKVVVTSGLKILRLS